MADEKNTPSEEKKPDIKKFLASLNPEDLGIPAPPPRKGDPGYEEYIEKEKNTPPWNPPEDSPKFMCNAEYWLPTAQRFAPTPKTVVIPVHYDLTFLCDGITPKGFDELVEAITKACDEVGWPAFLRTGQTSDKHSWKHTCGGCKSPSDIPRIVGMLTELSAMADLPLTCFLAREMLPTKPIFLAFDDMPITREFRLFAENGEITHIQPYWPDDAFLRPKDSYMSESDMEAIKKNPESLIATTHIKDDIHDWRDRLSLMSALSSEEYGLIAGMSKEISKALPLPVGGWSVDWLQDANGKWWLTDMAVEILSYKWKPGFEVIDDKKAEEAREKGIIAAPQAESPAPAM